MRIIHYGELSYIVGKPSENHKILQWISEAQIIDPDLVIGSDDCDETEVSFTVVSRNTTQSERQVIFQQAKAILNNR